MGRKRNYWDVLRRQKRVIKERNPTFILDPRDISYQNESGPEAANKPTPAETRPSSVPPATPADSALRRRIAKAFGIKPAEAPPSSVPGATTAYSAREKQIAEYLDISPAKVRAQHEHGKRRTQNASQIAIAKYLCMSLAEIRALRAETLKRISEHPDYKLKWSPHGRLDEPARQSPPKEQ
jgi:hypothetical protein